MEKKYLGKIKKASFGIRTPGGILLGLHLELSAPEKGNVQTSISWNNTEHNEYCVWTEKEQKEGYVNVMKKTAEILGKAKVVSVSELIGKPVEITFDGILLKDWRILTEVL